MFDYAVPFILHVGTIDAPFKAGSGISNEIFELMNLIKENILNLRKLHCLHQQFAMTTIMPIKKLKA